MIDEKAPEEITPDSPGEPEVQSTPEEIKTEEVNEPEQVDDKKLVIGSVGNMTIHNAGVVARERPPVPKNTVTIQVKYPKDFRGQRFFKDGDKREVSQESADQFVKKGIAKIIKE
jgi:hypothetical protein